MDQVLKWLPPRQTLVHSSTLVAVLLIVVFGVSPFIGEAISHVRTLSQQKARFEIYAAMASQREDLRARYEAWQAASGENVSFPTLGSREEATRLMTRNLEETASTQGLKVQIRPHSLDVGAEMTNTSPKFAVSLEVSGEIGPIGAFLERVGFSFPYYSFDDILLTPVEGGNGHLRLEAEVSSFLPDNHKG